MTTDTKTETKKTATPVADKIVKLKPKAAPKAKAEPKKAEPKKVVERGELWAEDAKITMISKEYERATGTKRHKHFVIATKSKTVGDYVKAGGSLSLLRWVVRHKWARVS